MEILIRGGHVVPGAGRPEIPHADVLVRDGVIVAVGPTGGATSTGGAGPAGTSAGSDSRASAGIMVIEAAGHVVTPGFVTGTATSGRRRCAGSGWTCRAAPSAVTWTARPSRREAVRAPR